MEWLETVTVKLSDENTLHTFPIPGSGVILAFILNILKNFVDRTELNKVTNWQRIVESFKYGYGKRTELGDANFVNITGVSNKKENKKFVFCIRSINITRERFLVVANFITLYRAMCGVCVFCVVVGYFFQKTFEVQSKYFNLSHNV